uniref:4-coumarate--CoA ligase 1-like isoform X1 n=1 Tax=Styela clava TaxID=7725 RepID=UPI00193A8CC6|nr:4-coumarate--CoA ligase 1-like isoform X1 [Styela clava]
MPLRSKHGNFDIPEISLSDFFLERIKEYGDDIALIDNINEENQLTFRQVYEQIQSCGNFFQKQKIGMGDVVCLITQNCVEYIVATVGVVSCGAAISLCNPSYKEGEIQHIFKITEPKIVIASEKSIDTIKQVLNNNPENQVQKIIVIGKSNEFETWDDIIISNKDNKGNIVPTCKISPKKDLAFLPYSSGTTGMPKCVMHTHYGTIAMILAIWHHLNYQRGDVFYNERPLYHGGGYFHLLVALQGGLSVIIDQKFDVDGTLAAIQKYKANHMLLVPPNLLKLSQTELHHKYDTSSWKSSFIGGASIPPTALKEVIDRFNIRVFPCYGQTECFPVSWNDKVDEFIDSAGSVAVNSEIMIVDPNTEKELKSGEDGEIWVKSTHMSAGYYKNSKATEQAINKDGFLRTGDIGHIENEMLFVVGRLKEVIKYNTFQVPPAEIEHVLMKHPGVKDAAAVGVPDEACGELPKAFVVRKMESVTTDELHELIKNELVDYKHLRGGIQFVNHIPKSILGKIDRIELKKWAMK